MGFSSSLSLIGSGRLWAAAAFGPSYYVGLALLVVVLVAALISVYRVWGEIHEDEEPDSPADLLKSFEQAHAAGVLDKEELDRVRRRLQAASTGAGEVPSLTHGPPTEGDRSESPPTGLDASPATPAADEGIDQGGP
jgi:hypothetical protein